LILLVFLGVYFLPVGEDRFDGAILESFELAKWYAREHVILCLVPAFFIAGAISVFMNQASVLKYLGARARRVVAYGVASVSGSILAVCSCTVLPLFAGIYQRGAGLGPATAFLYSGPAINVLAIILTARILGLRLGIARAVGAIVFSVIVGLLMHAIFRREEAARIGAPLATPSPQSARPLWKTAAYFAVLVGILVFGNWGEAPEPNGIWHAVHAAKWKITGLAALGLAAILAAWFRATWWRVGIAAMPAVMLALLVPAPPLVPFIAALVGLCALTSTREDELGEWFGASWGFAKQVLPLFLLGILVAGLLLGRPGREGLIPSAWVSEAVGGNSLGANLLASIVGAFMYFATLTEVPIVQALIGSGMGEGPALALLLAGPALSLPSMLVIGRIIGPRKTAVYVALVVVMATVSGLIFGAVLG
jgi:uncharacterized membrane protein YraQ (UPF0718 family)